MYSDHAHSQCSWFTSPTFVTSPTTALEEKEEEEEGEEEEEREEEEEGQFALPIYSVKNGQTPSGFVT